MRGDTLIEVLIALAVASVIISGITVLGTTSLSNAQFVAAQDKASKYAQEGQEIARQIRNSAYVKYGTNYTGTYCLDEGATSLRAGPCTTPNVVSQYIRSVTILQNDGCGIGFAHTTVTVSWRDGKCAAGSYCHTSNLSSCFSTQPPIPAP